jgi:hypothetical protein
VLCRRNEGFPVVVGHLWASSPQNAPRRLLGKTPDPVSQGLHSPGTPPGSRKCPRFLSWWSQKGPQAKAGAVTASGRQAADSSHPGGKGWQEGPESG